nr:glycosyltransferase family 2 protein [Actinomycetota bacterium]
MPGSTSARSDSAEGKSTQRDSAHAAVTPAARSRGERRLVGHTSTGRLVAARGLFTGPAPVVPDELYADVVYGSASRSRTRLAVNPNSSVTTDTYFGRFPASYWQRWTVVDEVVIEAVVTGSGKLSVVASDIEGEPRVVTAQIVDKANAEVVRLAAKLTMFLDGGFLWLEVATEADSLVIDEMRWTVDAPPVIRPTAVVICTFNRADDCVATLGALSSDPAALDVI